MLEAKVRQYEFVGVSTRSRTGCFSCRKRRKKCDEVKPVCGLCFARKSPCVWRKLPQSLTARVVETHKGVSTMTPSIVKPKRQKFDSSESHLGDIDFYTAAATLSDSTTTESTTTYPPLSRSNITSIISPMGSTSSSSLSSSKETTILSIDLEVLNHYSNITTFLDPKETIYFQNFYANALITSIVKEEEDNQYLTLFLKRAEQSSAVLQAIVTAGGIMMGGPDGDECKRTKIVKTLKMIDALLLVPNDQDYIDAIISYIILMEAHIIHNCVADWEYLFELVKQFVRKLGLYDKLCNNGDFPPQILDDEKWIAVNLVHHDLHSSLVNFNGTFFPATILMDHFQGVGTLQGVTKPMLCLFADCINLGVKAREKYHLLEVPGKLNNYQTTAQLNAIVDSLLELDSEMARLTPRPEDLAKIPKSMLEDHMSLFELYQFISQIYLRMAVKRHAPITPEIQIFVYKLINLLRFLINSDVKCGIKLPFLIAGINCVYDFDRAKIMNLLKQYEKNLWYHSNIKVIKKIIEEVWELNPDGVLCIDWYEITSKFGWTICLS